MSVDELVPKEQLVDEHSKALQKHLSAKEKLVKIVAIVSVLLVATFALLSVIQIEVTQTAIDYAQIEWNADFCQWQLYYFEDSNPDIWQRRAFVHITEWDIYENSRTSARFTIEGQDWHVQFNKLNISQDYRELKTVTLYYEVTVTQNLLGQIDSKVYQLKWVDFHLQ